MKNLRGRLIVFEGIDGSGKTLQLKKTSVWLRREGYKVRELREPTDGRYGQKLRLSASSGRLSPSDEQDLFLKDRRWNVARNIKPALADGMIVLLDRYYFSSIAYQGARGLHPNEIRRLNEAIAPAPDLVLLFDLDPKTALKRIRTQRGDSPNLFERVDYLKTVREIFLSLKDPFVVIIDATPPADAIWQKVQAAITPLFPPPSKR